MATRKPYPSDVSDEEWAFVAPYPTLIREDAPQRDHDLREVFNGVRWVVRTGSPWRYMPRDPPPWEAVYQRTQRWLRAGVVEEMVHALRVLLLSEGKATDPTATILDSRTLGSTRLPLSPAGSRHSQRGFITRSREMNAWLYRRSWTEADLETVGPLLERTEDVTIAITPRRWRAWDIRSTFFVALQEAGIALDDAET